MTEPLCTRAVVHRRPGEAGAVEEILLDPPGPGEVLVRLAAAGVCHSDLHLAEGHLGDHRFPTVLGHEGAGVVETVGAGVERPQVGEHVGLCFIPACGDCRYCRAGRANLCMRGSAAAFAGTMLDGTSRLCLRDGTGLRHFLGIACFAERCVVAGASAVPIPESLPLWQAALVGCALVTGIGAVRNAAGVEAGASVCVVGCGGVGLQVIAAAQAAGADPIVAVDRTPDKLELAQARGATHAVVASNGSARCAVRELTGGGVDYAFEVVGRSETIRLAWDVLRPGGTAVIVGLAPVGVEASVPALEFLDEKTLRGSFYGSGNPAREVAEIARRVADGGIEVAATVSHVTDLDGIEEAFARMRAGEGARTVAVIDESLAGL